MNTSANLKISNKALGVVAKIKSESRGATAIASTAFVKNLKSLLPVQTTMKKGKDLAKFTIKTDGKVTFTQKYKGIDITDFSGLKAALVK